MDLSGIQLLLDAAAAVADNQNSSSKAADCDPAPVVYSMPSVSCYTEVLTTSHHSMNKSVVGDNDLSFKNVPTSTPKKRSHEDELLSKRKKRLASRSSRCGGVSPSKNIGHASGHCGGTSSRDVHKAGDESDRSTKSNELEDDSFVDEYFEKFKTSLVQDEICNGGDENAHTDSRKLKNSFSQSNAASFQHSHKPCHGSGRSGDRLSASKTSSSSMGGGSTTRRTNNTVNSSGHRSTTQITGHSSGRSGDGSRAANKLSFSTSDNSTTADGRSSGRERPMITSSRSAVSLDVELSKTAVVYPEDDSFVDEYFEKFQNSLLNDDIYGAVEESQGANGEHADTRNFNNTISQSNIAPCQLAHKSGYCSGRSGHELSASNKSKSSTDGSSATRRAFKTGHASGYSSSDRLATTTNHTNVRSSSDDNPTTNTTSRSSVFGGATQTPKRHKSGHGSGHSAVQLTVANTSSSSRKDQAYSPSKDDDKPTVKNAFNSSFSGGVTRPPELLVSGHSFGHGEDQLTVANTSCVSKDHPYGRSSGDDTPTVKKASSSSFSGGVTRPNELHESGHSSGHSEDQLTIANTSCVSKDHAYGRSSGDDKPALKKASSSSFSGGVTRPNELHESGQSFGHSEDQLTVANTSCVSKDHAYDRSIGDDTPAAKKASSSSFSGGVTRPNELHESGHSSGHSEDQLTIANTSCVSKDHAYGRSSGDDKPALKKASSSSFSGGVTRPNELHEFGQSFGHSEDQLTVANTSCVSKDHAYDRSNGDDTPAAKKASSSSFSGDVTRPPELHKSGHSSSQSDDKFTVINTSSVSKDRENGRSSGERTIINASSCSGGTVQPHKPHSSKRASDHRGSASNPSSSSGVDPLLESDKTISHCDTSNHPIENDPDPEFDYGDIDDEDQEVEIGDVTLLNDFIVDEYFEKFHNLTLIINDDYEIDEAEGTRDTDSADECGESHSAEHIHSSKSDPVDTQIIDGDLGFDETEANNILKKPKPNKRKIAQNARMRGLEYERPDGTLVPARSVKPGCGCSKLKCSENYRDSTRKKLLENLLRLTTSGQNQFLSNHMTVRPTARPKINSRRLYSRSYFLPAVNGRIRVCKQMFMATFDVKDKKLRILADKQLIGKGITADDLRSGNGTHKTLSVEDNMYITEHIKSFPAYTSHYGRERTSKLYLSSDLSVMRMHDMYKSKCAQENREAVHYTTYRRIFKQMNIGFRKLKVDTCCECDKFAIALKLATDADRSDLEALRDAHHHRAQEAYRQKRNDVKAAKEDVRYRTASFDLQKCLPTPHLTCGTAFYSRQLYTLNLTIFSTHNGSNSVDCYLWDESKARRGSQEIGSCLLKDLKNMDDRVEEMVYYSDRCAGQNHNIIICMLFLAFIEHSCSLGRQITIQHKFMTSGHSHMEVDSAHAAIEKAKKRCAMNIETPRDWAVFIAAIHRKIPFNVTEMLQPEFLALKKLDAFFNRPKTNIDKEPLKFKEISVFKYSTNHPGIVLYKHALDDESFKSFSMDRQIPVVMPPPLTDEPIPLAQEKLEDLRKLMEFVGNKEYYATLLKQIVPKKRGRRGKSNQVDHFENDLDEEDDHMET